MKYGPKTFNSRKRKRKKEFTFLAKFSAFLIFFLYLYLFSFLYLYLFSFLCIAGRFFRVLYLLFLCCLLRIGLRQFGGRWVFLCPVPLSLLLISALYSGYRVIIEIE